MRSFHIQQKLLLAIMSVMVVASGASCALYEDVEQLGTPASRVEVDPEEATVEIGSRIDLEATVYRDGDNVLTGREVTWTSTDDEVATVDADGEVTGISAGEVTIRARTLGATGSAQITVVAAVDRVEVDPQAATIEVTESVRLEATAYDANGQESPGRTFTWSTDRPEVAAVDQSGRVEGMSGGEAIITAQLGDVSAEAIITVQATPTDLEVAPDPATVQVDDTLQMSATFTDAAGNEVSGPEVTWTVDDEGIATVNDDGRVRGRSGGETAVTATAGDLSDSATVIVENPAALVEVSPDPVTLNVLDTQQMSVYVEDSAGNELSDRSVRWRSQDTDIATIDSDGIVTGRSDGTVDITATVDGAVGTAEVTVDNPVTDVEINPDSPTINVNDVLQLTVIARDIRGNVVSADNVTWTSSEPNTVSIDANGVVVGLREGQSTVRAQVDAVIGETEVSVEAPVDTLTLSPQSATVEVGETIQLDVDLRDQVGNELTGRTVNWSSSDTDIADVDATGLVEGIAGGTVTITAESESVSDTATVEVDNRVRSVVVTPDPAALEVAQTEQLTARAYDNAGNELSGHTFSWSSADADIASVDATGLVTAESGGSTTVSASTDDPDGTPVVGAAVVDVDDPVVSVEIVPQKLSLFPNDQAQLDAVLRDANDNVITGRAVTWSSVDPTIVDVDASGLADAGAALGSTTITAESEGVSDSITADVAQWEQVAVSYSYSCGVLTSGQAYCWGKNSPEGRLGNGTQDSSTSGDPNDWVGDANTNEPSLVEGGHSFSKVVPSLWHTCALNKSGEAYCWGHNGWAQLGDGTGNSSPVPVKVSGGQIFEDIVSGRYHTCGLSAGGDAYCWGQNTSGQIARDPTNQVFFVPQQITGVQFETIAAGIDHTCGLTPAGDILCWGGGGSGQLGNGAVDDEHTPGAISSTETFVDVGSGWLHSCGLTTNDEVYCWGANDFGQLGDGTTTQRETPVRADSSRTYMQLVVGVSATCGVDTTQDAYCWGFNGQGNLGSGGIQGTQTSPTLVSGGYAWASMSLGWQHSCGLADQEVDAFCWGDNDHGEIGDGTEGTNRTIPTIVNRP